MQGGTCLLFGDEHKSLVEMEQLVREHIGCRVAYGSRYYRADGHHQQSFNEQPIQVNALHVPSCALQVPACDLINKSIQLRM